MKKFPYKLFTYIQNYSNKIYINPKKILILIDMQKSNYEFTPNCIMVSGSILDIWILFL